MFHQASWKVIVKRIIHKSTDSQCVWCISKKKRRQRICVFFQKCDESKSWLTDAKTCSKCSNPYIFSKQIDLEIVFSEGTWIGMHLVGIQVSIAPSQSTSDICQRWTSGDWSREETYWIPPCEVVQTYSRLSRHKLNYWLVAASGNRGIQHHAKPHLHIRSKCNSDAGFGLDSPIGK